MSFFLLLNEFVLICSRHFTPIPQRMGACSVEECTVGKLSYVTDERSQW